MQIISRNIAHFAHCVAETHVGWAETEAKCARFLSAPAHCHGPSHPSSIMAAAARLALVVVLI